MVEVRELIAREYLPGLLEIQKHIQTGINELCDANEYKLTPDWLLTADLVANLELYARRCFINRPAGEELLALRNLIGWLNTVLEFLRWAWQSGSLLKVKRNDKIIQGANMLKSIVAQLEKDEERLLKRKLIPATPNEKEK